MTKIKELEKKHQEEDKAFSTFLEASTRGRLKFPQKTQLILKANDAIFQLICFHN